jgi:4-hydroxybenzoate polyprenyltransferase
MNKVAAYARLLRIPGLGGLAIPPVIGAITVGVFDFYSLAILFIIGSLAAIYGFILNDYADVELDKLTKELHGKPLVSGDVSLLNAVAICVFCILFSFFFIFLLWKGSILDDLKLAALGAIVLAGVLGSIYDLIGKKIIGADFIIALSVAFVFLFGALSFGMPTVFTWVVFLLTFNNLLHMNAVENGIKDADHDPLIGVKNIALKSGVRVDGKAMVIPWTFKSFSLGIRFFSAILLFIPFVFFDYPFYWWQILLLILVIIGVVTFSYRLLSIEIFDRSKIRRFIALQSFLRYSLVPLMLLSTIGILPSVILILFPIIWYIVFTPLLGEKLFRPRM